MAKHHLSARHGRMFFVEKHIFGQRLLTFHSFGIILYSILQKLYLLIDFSQQSGKLVFVDLCRHYGCTVGRGLAPAETFRFWIFWLNGSR